MNSLFEAFQHSGEEELPKIPNTGNSQALQAFMLPQYFLSCLPFSLFNKFNDLKTGWEGFDHINDLFLQLLDSNSVFNTHTVGVLYIPPESIYIYIYIFSKRIKRILHTKSKRRFRKVPAFPREFREIDRHSRR